MSLPPTYRPSPLSLGSSRSSPFRRPESPATSSYRRADSPSGASSTASYPSTPTPSSPTKQPPTNSSTGNTFSPSAHRHSHSTSSLSNGGSGVVNKPSSATTRTTSSSSSSYSSSSNNDLSSTPRASMTTTSSSISSTAATAFTSLPVPLLNQLRQTFSLMDRSNTGSITRADVAATLAQAGLPSSDADVAPFFTGSHSSALTLAQFLAMMGAPLSQLSSGEELTNAFGAFDERDVGEIDVSALKDAIGGLPPQNGTRGARLSARDVDRALEGFVGKKTFRGGGMGGASGGGDVFRYRDWIGNVTGAPVPGQQAPAAAGQDRRAS